MTSLVVVALVAAGLTLAVVPLSARLARRFGALGHRIGEGPDDPEPAVPVPTLGGLAMLVGLLGGVAVAAASDVLRPVFASSQLFAVVVGAGLVALLGAIDDVIGLSPPVKLAGQLVAATAVAVLGLQLVHFWVPGLGVLALSPDLALVLTVIALVAMINVVNLIDGLDGLASSVVAIGAVAFLVFTLRSQTPRLADAVPTSATLIATLTAAVALGFLVHNWYPARSFMGDTGSMLLGLLVGAAGVAHVGRTAAPSGADFTGTVPLLVPVLVLAVPFVDLVLAVVRRLRTGRPITERDERHVHHLLLSFGHSHRRTTLILSYWSAVIAVATLLPAFVGRSATTVTLGAAVVVGVVVTVLGRRALGWRPDADDRVDAVAGPPAGQ